MQSFRTEIENPVVEKDIIELEKKIRLYREGRIDEEKFRSLRLARGVYGQRQEGVQMVRIKLPFGKFSAKQLLRICEVSERYSNGKMHITTRQDVQIHYVSLEKTPELWAFLEKDDLTLREACGNTVRNITASDLAGIDPEEPFDVSDYADAMFRYFLRNSVCQEMGRKIKMSFSSSERDTALTCIHDLGFLPVVRDGKRGFRVMIGGGLGAQPQAAELLSEFVEANKIIPLTESVLRVFDRYGERLKRQKARLKFLIKEIGLEKFSELIAAENAALSAQVVEVLSQEKELIPVSETNFVVSEKDLEGFETWKENQVFYQKQKGFVAIGIKVTLGNMDTKTARKLAEVAEKFQLSEMRFTIRQNIQIRNVAETILPAVYVALKEIGLTKDGFQQFSDITACPGTDTCNLGIASSTGIALELEKVLENEFPKWKNNPQMDIKISGCMNACGQHNLAAIGFQGMSINIGKLVAPALQVLLGGGALGNGQARFADKVIKIPSKRGPEALRILINDFENNGNTTNYLDYYQEKSEKYFYEILKPLADTTNLTPDDYIDWGNAENYVKAVGIGECAGVVIDLVATLLVEANDKLENAKDALIEKRWSDAIYFSYTAMIHGAKSILLSENHKTNQHATIIEKMDEVFIVPKKIQLDSTFASLITEMQNHSPEKEFAEKYFDKAQNLLENIRLYREALLV